MSVKVSRPRSSSKHKVLGPSREKREDFDWLHTAAAAVTVLSPNLREKKK